MRIPSLNGLRAISILCVLVAHLSGNQNFISSHALELYGKVGVRVFFILSGYLITHLLLKERQKTGTISLRGFYLRRMYRIIPASYVFMVIVIAANWKALSWPNIVTALTFSSSYYHRGNWVLGHLWSLSVQEQFYLLWPLALLLFFRFRVPILLAVIASGPPMRILFWLLWGRPVLDRSFPVFADCLAVGCLLAIVEPRLKAWDRILTSRWFLAVPVVTVLIPLMQLYNSRAYQVAGLTLVHVGIALSVVHAIKKEYWFLNWPPLAWIGGLSYSIYLWQQPFLNRSGTTPWTAFPLNVVLAFACAVISQDVVQRPFMRLRDRSRPRPADDKTREQSDAGKTSQAPEWRAA